MIVFDLAHQLTLGAACAMYRSTSPKPRNMFRDAFALSILVAMLCVVSLAIWPGWQSMYLVDLDGNLARLMTAEAVQVAALIACFQIGFTLVAPALYRFDPRHVRLLAGIAWLLLLGFLSVVLYERAFFVTSFRDFSSRTHFEIGWGKPDSLLGGSVMCFLVVSGALNILCTTALFARHRPSA